jgi:hypothetical protein
MYRREVIYCIADDVQRNEIIIKLDLEIMSFPPPHHLFIIVLSCLIHIYICLLGTQYAEDELIKFKAQLRDITNETKIQFDETNRILEHEKLQVKRISSLNPSEILEYTKDPCKNCQGPLYCLNGQIVGKRPENPAKIKISPKMKFYKGRSFPTMVRVDFNHFGLSGVDDQVRWYTQKPYKSLGKNTIDDDFTKFVYFCNYSP